MKQHKFYLPCLSVLINKDPERNSILIDIFYKKKLIIRDVFHSTRVSPNNEKYCTFYACFTNLHYSGNWEVRNKMFGSTSKALYSQEYPRNLIQEAIPKAKIIFIGYL